MTSPWDAAIQVAADTLGEMLVAMADGQAEYANEDLAAAVLKTGLATLLDGGPGAERTAEAAGVLYAKLHDAADQAWESLPQIEKAFWLDLARAALRASDQTLSREAERLQTHPPEA